MHTTIVIIMILLFSLPLFGTIFPDTTETPGEGMPVDFIFDRIIHLPPPKTLDELLYRTQRGEFDPVAVIGTTADRGGEVIDSLRMILREVPDAALLQTVEGPAAGTGEIRTRREIDTFALQRMRIYALLALESMNPDSAGEAYTQLAGIAADHDDAELRGIALHALGTTLHDQMSAYTPPPSKELVYLFIRSMDDPLPVEFHFTTMHDIARRGLKNWTGIDPGEPLDHPANEEDREQFTSSQYWEKWWEENNEKLEWKPNERVFKINRQTEE
jgi:hypothetical protein